MINAGWLDKGFKDYTPGMPVAFNITQSAEGFYVDNGMVFKEFPPTHAGWLALCEELKGLDPKG